MNTAFDDLRNEGRRLGRKEVRSEALAEAVLELLTVRKVKISREERRRIRASRSPAQIRKWLTKAAKTDSAAALFSRSARA